MASRLTLDRSSSFRIKRPLVTTSGFVSDVDPDIVKHLEELDKLLSKRVLGPGKDGHDDVLAAGEHDAAAAAAAAAAEQPADGKPRGNGNDRAGRARTNNLVKALLRAELAPKRVPPGDGDPSAWRRGSLADLLSRAQEDDSKQTLSEHIDFTPELSQLKYAFRGSVAEGWLTLDYNSRAVLDAHPAISDYLVAYAYHVMGLRDGDGLRNFILKNRSGTRGVADYAVISATRTLIDREQLKVTDYNKDDSGLVSELRKGALSLAVATFEKAARARIKDFVFNTDEAKIIDEAKIGKLPEGIKPALIKLMQRSPVPITKDNAELFLPHFILQITRSDSVLDVDDTAAIPLGGQFDVQFKDDASVELEISRGAVRCAAQLYHGMVLGDELDVFGAVNYLTHKRLFQRGGMEIKDSRLRADLQMYVFSNKFTDLQSKAVMERTRPAERQMFYRQVFSRGGAQVPDDVLLNTEFQTLWKVLILESARYLEHARESFHPDSFVSRQNVMQAVEDLQYNLSIHCVGMATVIAPSIDAELNFVLTRILKHPEVIQQVAPAGGTWKRVVDKLHAEQMRHVPAAATLYNKAKLGQAIIQSIAGYTPAAFEDDEPFSTFISQVDAYITTESKLQGSARKAMGEAVEDRLGLEPPEDLDAEPAMPPALPRPEGDGNGAAAAEWDF